MPAHGVQNGRHVLDVQRPVAAHPSRGVDPPLRAFEVGEHVVPSPADVAHAAPIVEIRRHAAAIDQRVDGTRAADHAAARPVHGTAVQARDLLRLVFPVHRRIGKRAPVADRRPDPEARIGPAGLEHQHPIAAARGQSVGEHAARGTRADDDVVEILPRKELSLIVRRRHAISRFAHVIFRNPGAAKRRRPERPGAVVA